MARPTTEKVCITCGKPFLPSGGRQMVCPVCKAEKKPKPQKTLGAVAKAAAELGASYGRYVAMSMEERSKLKEEKTMAEQQKTTEMGTIKTQTTENQVQQVQNQVQPERDALQEYISYLEQQSVELTARIERIRIALEEAAAYSSVRHSEWRQHKENPRTGGNQ